MPPTPLSAACGHLESDSDTSPRSSTVEGSPLLGPEDRHALPSLDTLSAQSSVADCNPSPSFLVRQRNRSGSNLTFGGQRHAYRIVLTGGPCAGKSSAMAHLQEKLTSQGFLVFTLPEVATLMFNAGADWSRFAKTEKGLVLYQSALIRLQIAHEDGFLRLSQGAQKPCVVICDRGLLDGKAYCSPQVWALILDRVKLTEEVMLARYDAVAFMVTAAEGAALFYTKDNNAARRETPDEAIETDRRLRECWAGHRHLKVFHNERRTFRDKIQSVAQFVLHRLAASHLPHRFGLRYATIEGCRAAIPPGVDCLEQVTDELACRLGVLKMVTSGGQVRYYIQEEQVMGDVIIERTSQILQEVFLEYRRQAEAEGSTTTVTTTSLLFNYHNVTWEVYYSDSAAQYVLRTYASPDKDVSTTLPPFLEVGVECESPLSPILPSRASFLLSKDRSPMSPCPPLQLSFSVPELPVEAASETTAKGRGARPG